MQVDVPDKDVSFRLVNQPAFSRFEVKRLDGVVVSRFGKNRVAVVVLRQAERGGRAFNIQDFLKVQIGIGKQRLFL